jgi:hypothetical protein
MGAIPALSVAAATLFPLSGNRQHWDGYAKTHLSWFLFTPIPTRIPMTTICLCISTSA